MNSNKDEVLVEAHTTQYKELEEPRVIRWICVGILAMLLVLMHFAFKS